MINKKKQIGFLTGFILIVAIFGLYDFLGLCDNDIIKNLPSKDNAYKAIVFNRSCGATTSDSVQVSIKRFNDELSDSENGSIFIMDENNIIDAKAINPIWQTDNILLIKYPKTARIYKKVQSFKGINIDYSIQ